MKYIFVISLLACLCSCGGDDDVTPRATTVQIDSTEWRDTTINF